MRIVLLVDSSTPVGPMLNNFRTALNAFIDELPEEEEVVFVSSGGQIRVRTQPGTDRVKLRAEVARFAAEGGANAFLDTMLEADKRFLKTGAGPMARVRDRHDRQRRKHRASRISRTTTTSCRTSWRAAAPRMR